MNNELNYSIAQTALNKMFKDGSFSICTIDNIARMMNIQPETEAPLWCNIWWKNCQVPNGKRNRSHPQPRAGEAVMNPLASGMTHSSDDPMLPMLALGRTSAEDISRPEYQAGVTCPARANRYFIEQEKP